MVLFSIVEHQQVCLGATVTMVPSGLDSSPVTFLGTLTQPLWELAYPSSSLVVNVELATSLRLPAITVPNAEIVVSTPRGVGKTVGTLAQFSRGTSATEALRAHTLQGTVEGLRPWGWCVAALRVPLHRVPFTHPNKRNLPPPTRDPFRLVPSCAAPRYNITVAFASLVGFDTIVVVARVRVALDPVPAINNAYIRSLVGQPIALTVPSIPGATMVAWYIRCVTLGGVARAGP